MSRLTYRPDIDCLRALAVVSVIGYHFNVPPFRSGFTGVDVFFVISGFLITSIIHTDVEAGEFSFLRFYERRIRRILPALYVVTAATLAFAYLCLPPLEYSGLAKQSLSVIAFCSNVLFWAQHGYFDGASISKPLLQTWSLSVEEQFYIIFPAALVWIATIKGRRPYTAMLFGIFAVSLALCIFQTTISPPSAFYLLHARAWEFALGGLIAIGGFPKPATMRMQAGAAITGWVALGISTNVFIPSAPYPGASALLPCAGAALVIWAAVPAGRFITLLRPVLFIGLISYSLYLWHWPIAVFSNLILGPKHPPLVKFVLIAACFAISTASYVFIEQPFRQPASRLRTIVVGAMCLVAGSILIIVTNGFEGRISERDVSIGRYAQYDYASTYSAGRCFAEPPFLKFDERACLTPEDGKQNVLVWGDSYAAHLVHGLQKAYPETHFMQATKSGCAPLLGPSAPRNASCMSFNNTVLHSIRSAMPDAVIISSNWIDYSFEAGLAELLKTLPSVRVFVVGPTPAYDDAFPRIYVSQILYRSWYEEPQTRLVPGIFKADEKLSRALAAFSNAIYISPLSKLCKNAECTTFVGDVPLIWDAGHLTAEGSELVANAIKPEMELDRATKLDQSHPDNGKDAR